MASIHSNKVKALIHSIGLKYGLTDDKIKQITDSPYLFADGVINDLSFNKPITEEEFNQLKTNFYFKNLGKLHIPFPRLEKRQKNKVKTKEK